MPEGQEELVRRLAKHEKAVSIVLNERGPGRAAALEPHYQKLNELLPLLHNAKLEAEAKRCRELLDLVTMVRMSGRRW